MRRAGGRDVREMCIRDRWTQGINVALNLVSVVSLGLAANGVNLLLPMIFVMFFTQF